MTCVGTKYREYNDMLAPVAIASQGWHVSMALSATADHHILCRARCFTSRSAINDIPPYEKSAKSAGAIVLNLHNTGAILIANLAKKRNGLRRAEDAWRSNLRAERTRRSFWYFVL